MEILPSLSARTIAMPVSRAAEIAGVSAAVAVLVLATVAVVAVDLGSSGVPGAGVPAFGHVFLILGENAEAPTLNTTNAEYLLGTLRPGSAWLTNYFGLTHHSEANYVGLTSGQYTLCEQLNNAPDQCHQDVGNVFQQLDRAGISWHAWVESMPSPCYVSDAGSVATLNPYDPGHNPAVLYDNIEGPGGTWSSGTPSAGCLANDVPAGTTGPNDMSALNDALASGSVPRFNLIIPNECDSGEKACPSTSDRIAQFDAFLRREVPLILASPAFGADGVLVVTFDEGTSAHLHLVDRARAGGQIALAIMSPLVLPGSYDGFGNHYSLLRMLEDGFRLSAYLAGAARGPALAPRWVS